MSFESQYTASY